MKAFHYKTYVRFVRRTTEKITLLSKRQEKGKLVISMNTDRTANRANRSVPPLCVYHTFQQQGEAHDI